MGKILVTGATGFIGNSIVKNLISKNYEVVGISKNYKDSENKIKIITSDITDTNKVLKLCENEDLETVIHCAGLAHQFGKVEKNSFEQVNVIGTRNITDLAVKKKAKKFILLSSTAVYGLQNSPMSETSACFPNTDYAESKLESEKICREICEENNISLTIFRLAPVLGEKGIGNVPRLIRAIDQKRFLWIGKGENRKSLIYVEDIADACLYVLETERATTEIYNLSAEPIKMNSLVGIISKNLNKPVPKFYIPSSFLQFIFGLNRKSLDVGLLKKISQTFEKWVSEDLYPADKFKNDYGFKAKTTIEQAVEKQCAWFLQNYKK